MMDDDKPPRKVVRAGEIPPPADEVRPTTVLHLSLDIGTDIKKDIREAVMGQVRGIVRAEFNGEVQTEVNKRIRDHMPSNSDIKASVMSMIKKTVTEQTGIYIQQNQGEMKEWIMEAAKESLKEQIPALLKGASNELTNAILKGDDVQDKLNAIINYNVKKRLRSMAENMEKDGK